MRNLQKILALALALIMSFSLVVTANAAFSDEADINETYNESVNVLAQLEVFRGYTDGSYKPQDSITRAEVAAIIYRIATGDVSDSQVSLYSDWNRFKDVASGSWYAGYVNYCANAEYIKGYEDGSFRPNNNVTGYEALAMILRAVGYGKMDEFVGSNWAVNTAARANTLKISKNVTAALLGSPASREVVAELLFRSILVPTVTYNNAFGYQETDTTLGYDSFKLEQIEGVVVANEYANLYDTQVLEAGKTDLELAKDDVRSLDIASALTDVGESRYAYVSGSKVYALENTGRNVVKETGESTTIKTDKKFRDFSGLDKTSDTEFYLNFGREGKFSCDYRLEFTVIFYTEDAQDTFTSKYHNVPAYAYACNTDKDNKDNDWTVRHGTWSQDAEENVTLSYAAGEPSDNGSAYLFPAGANSFVEYNRIIRAKEEITSEEMDIIEGIFASADNISSNGLDKDKVTGDVYLGTKSNLDKDDKERDISNEISFRKFKDEYINSQIWDQDIENSGNGEWLKIVDNDGDGKADYAFLTQYWLDKAISSYTKSGETILEFNSVDVEAFEDNDGIIEYVDEIAVNDVVYYTNIDNRITMTKAPVVTAKIKTVNFKDDSCTTTEDTTYVESDIFNKSRLDQEVENLDDEVEYNLYFDAYGYVRAYELAQGNTYGLLTELYKTTTQNAQYVKGVDLTAELKKGAEKIDEFDVSNSKDNVFLLDGIAAKANDNNWNNLHKAVAAIAGKWIYKNVYSVDRDSTILLQPAIGQLGLEYEGDARNAGNIFRNVTTNVATYIETGDNEVRLTSPVKYATNEKGQRLYYANDELQGGKYVKGEELSDGTKVGDDYPAYAVDYIALDLSEGLSADARRYDISEQSRYAKQSGKYVNAVHDTEYYIVNTNTQKADYFTNYEKVYAISKDHIIAAYAVAQNTVADHNGDDYWVADVIVIEVSGLDTIFDSVGVLYTNPSQTSGSVKLIKTLNTESEDPAIDMIPEDWEWAPQNNGNWVYEVDENELKDGVLYADTVQYIAQNYNAKGIYAGIVSHVEEVNNRGGYIDVIMPGYDRLTDGRAAADVKDWVDSVSVNNDQLFAIGSSSGKNYSLRDLRVTRSATTDRVEVGDRVIWGEDKNGNTAFVIDVSFTDDSWVAPAWLTSEVRGEGLWYTVASEQVELKGATTFEEALNAYRKWAAGDMTAADAKEIIESALKYNLKLTDEQKARLEDLLKDLTGGAVDPTSGPSLTVKTGMESNVEINAATKKITVKTPAQSLSVKTFKTLFDVEGTAQWVIKSGSVELSDNDLIGSNATIEVTVTGENGETVVYRSYDVLYKVTYVKADGTTSTQDKAVGADITLNSSRVDKLSYFTITDEEGNFYGIDGKIATKDYTGGPDNQTEPGCRYNWKAASNNITCVMPEANITVTSGYHAANVAGATAVNGKPINDSVGGAGPQVLFLKEGNTVTVMKDSLGRLLTGSYVEVVNTPDGGGGWNSVNSPAKMYEIEDGAVTLEMPDQDLYYRDGYWGVYVDGELAGYVYNNREFSVGDATSATYYSADGGKTIEESEDAEITADSDVSIIGYYAVEVTLTNVTADQFTVEGAKKTVNDTAITYVVEGGGSLTITPKTGVTIYVGDVAYNKDSDNKAISFSEIDANVEITISDTAPVQP